MTAANTTKTATPTKKEKVVEISKLHKQETHKQELSNGKTATYVFQYPGTRIAEGITSRYLSSNDKVKFYEELMETIIVSPSVDFDYWDEKENEGYAEVMNAADRFLGTTHFG